MAKSVLITGASSGIGRATAPLMARRGWRVAASARDLSRLDQDPGHACFRIDVTDDRSIADAVARTVERFGRIDVLVNNAGYGMFGPLEGAAV